MYIVKSNPVNIKLMTYLFSLLILLNFACSPKSDPMDNLKELIKSGKDVYVENADFSGDIDLTAFLQKNLISEGVYGAKTSSSITFNNCRFNGKVIAFRTENNASTMVSFLSNLSFINCQFNFEVNVRGCSILGTENNWIVIVNKWDGDKNDVHDKGGRQIKAEFNEP